MEDLRAVQTGLGTSHAFSFLSHGGAAASEGHVTTTAHCASIRDIGRRRSRKGPNIRVFAPGVAALGWSQLREAEAESAPPPITGRGVTRDPAGWQRRQQRVASALSRGQDVGQGPDRDFPLADGSDHHEGSFERGPDRSQPLKEKI